jgi:hypothetical protein
VTKHCLAEQVLQAQDYCGIFVCLSFYITRTGLCAGGLEIKTQFWLQSDFLTKIALKERFESESSAFPVLIHTLLDPKYTLKGKPAPAPF